MNPCGGDVPSLLPLLPRTPLTGWIVLSEELYRSNDFVGLRLAPCGSPSHCSFNLAPVDSFDWLKPLQPVARVGASLRLYYIPELDRHRERARGQRTKNGASNTHLSGNEAVEPVDARDPFPGTASSVSSLSWG